MQLAHKGMRKSERAPGLSRQPGMKWQLTFLGNDIQPTLQRCPLKLQLSRFYLPEMSELQVGFPLKFMSLHLGQMGDRTSVTVSPLHMYLQVAYFQRWEHISACLITKVSSLVWHILSCARILYKLLFFCVLYCTEYSSTVSLETEMNPARNQNPSHQCQPWVKSQLALCLLLLMILQLHHLPPPLPPPVSNSSHPSTPCQPLYASSCTVYIIYVKSVINLWQYSTI